MLGSFFNSIKFPWNFPENFTTFWLHNHPFIHKSIFLPRLPRCHRVFSYIEYIYINSKCRTVPDSSLMINGVLMTSLLKGH